MTLLFESRDVPIYVNFLWRSREAALACPRGDITLAFCGDCGLIFNVAFEPSKLEYREGYENSLHFSPVFQAYAEKLADSLIERFALRDKTVVEIGCGGGEFLQMLCERGPNRGLGFDPSPRLEGEEAPSNRVELIHDYYSERYVDRGGDFLCCRHTLEHIAHPGDLLEPIRRSIGDRVDLPVFFEVPNAMYMLENFFVWDIIYEHASYFTTPALKNAFSRSGFRVADVYEAFSGQYLCMEAYASTAPVESAAVEGSLLGAVESFRTAYGGYYEMWKTKLRRLADAGKKVVLWGAGSKGVMFANCFDVSGLVERVVDVNPKKHGMFVAGSGQEIVPPSRLAADPPDVAIVANPVYLQEISEIVRAMGIQPDLIPL
ncbi:MAG: class I SAM-dependent methyltransferase [bacterium]